MSAPPADDPRQAASDALDAGLPEAALAHLERCPPDDPDAALLRCYAHLALGRLAEADACLATARAADPDHPDVLFAAGELALQRWAIADARRAFERLVAVEPGAEALERLSLCHDLEEDFAAADRLLARAAALDPEGAPLPPRLDDEAFDAVVAAAVAELPDTYRRALARARLVKEPMPFAELAPRDDPAATPPDLLGLFTGPTLHDLAEDASGELPPTIYLFQRNLERAARDEDELREEIRITLFHELGHLLGLDEDEVDALGLG